MSEQYGSWAEGKLTLANVLMRIVLDFPRELTDSSGDFVIKVKYSGPSTEYYEKEYTAYKVTKENYGKTKEASTDAERVREEGGGLPEGERSPL